MLHRILCVTALVAAGCSRPSGGPADLIVTDAAVWTGDPSHPGASALAAIGDRIVAVGGATEIDHWRGPETVVVDAGGRRVVPGFDDAHVHFAAGGAQLVSVDLRDAGSPEEFARRIVERARSRPGEWILGGRWDARRWSPAAAPTRALIDEGTNGTPVLVTSADGRSALANAAALGRAGITERSPDPEFGRIVRDAQGFPTGLLEGAAVDAVARVVPKPTAEERRQSIARALDHAASFGVTSVQDMNPDPADVAVYAELAERGQLTTRIYAIANETGWFEQARLGIRRAFGSPVLRLGGVAGDAVHDGADQILTRLIAADHAGLQLCLNAENAGAASALDLVASVVRANGERDRRMRIERAERGLPGEQQRFAALATIASVQPAAAPPGTLKRFHDRGVALAIGTDWPSLALNPMTALAAAAREIGAKDALVAYTRAGAFAEFQDAVKGTIARGALADLVILSDDVLRLPPERIATVSVVATIVAGKVVHQRRP